MTIDLHRHLRRIKVERLRAQLVIRPRTALIATSDLGDAKNISLLLDTNVYIQMATGKLPEAVKLLVQDCLPFHCSVCVAELVTGVANADPAHPGWKGTRDYYADMIADIPKNRFLTPDAEIWADAGLVSGALARVQKYQRHQRKECLNDALIYLTAAKAGVAVLTANRDEFDLIQQVVPDGRFVHF